MQHPQLTDSQHYRGRGTIGYPPPLYIIDPHEYLSKSTQMNTNVQNPTDFEELLDGMTPNGKYDYLRIILTKNSNRTIPEKYLMVTEHGFSKIKLLAVDFLKDSISIDFQCTSTGMVKSVNLDVEDSEFRFLLVGWNDIRKMVLDEYVNVPNDDLLEFDF